jgi:hypothetical protein
MAKLSVVVRVMARYADVNDSVPIGRASGTDKPISLVGAALPADERDE